MAEKENGIAAQAVVVRFLLNFQLPLSPPCTSSDKCICFLFVSQVGVTTSETIDRTTSLGRKLPNGEKIIWEVSEETGMFRHISPVCSPPASPPPPPPPHFTRTRAKHGRDATRACASHRYAALPPNGQSRTKELTSSKGAVDLPSKRLTSVALRIWSSTERAAKCVYNVGLSPFSK